MVPTRSRSRVGSAVFQGSTPRVLGLGDRVCSPYWSGGLPRPGPVELPATL